MPERVAALPRSAGGLPVPYVAQWEGEERMRIEHCYHVGADAIFPIAGPQIARTRPVFGVMEPARQREACAAVRCQVCRLQLSDISSTLEEGRELHWLVDMLHEPATFPGHKLAMEPWVCDDCIVYALQVCPGLISPLPGQTKLRNVLAVWTANLISPMIAPAGNLKGKPPCIGYLKIEPLRYLRISRSTLLEYGPVAIREMLRDEVPAVAA